MKAPFWLIGLCAVGACGSGQTPSTPASPNVFSFVEGRVSEAGGRPVEHAEIRIRPLREVRASDGATLGFLDNVGFTDKNGNYSIKFGRFNSPGFDPPNPDTISVMVMAFASPAGATGTAADSAIAIVDLGSSPPAHVLRSFVLPR
jgi:hypothetical protein